MRLQDKDDRIFNLMTESEEKLAQRKPIKYLWNKIKQLFTQL